MDHTDNLFAPTLADVAVKAGVSLATASRVLNGSTRKVAASYRERVLTAAAALGYTANLSAQATARGTSSVVALLVADIADPYFGQIASGVARGADEAGLVMTISITERDFAREAHLVRTLRGMRPLGLILAASRTAGPVPAILRQEFDAFRAAGGTIVALGAGAGDVRSVDIDNFGGARALGEELGNRGYSRAHVLGAAAGVRSSDDRIAGFVEGFEAASGIVSRVHRGDYTRTGGARAMTQALADGIPTGTLVFVVSDMAAVGAMSALREAGRQAGSDIAVAGFDDTATGRDVTPSLTSVHIPLEEVGYQALRAVTDETWILDHTKLMPSVVIRDSTPDRR